jgi:SAM-dependent methyltransferase
MFLGSKEPELLNEPLAESAPLARRWAEHHCTDCGWYHGFWQHMRLMGLGKTLSGQGSYFLASAAKWRDHPAPRVLVSGCADYSALAYVVAGLGRDRFDAAELAQLVVLDRCKTPMQLSRWYADRVGLPAQTVQSVQADILDFKPTVPFDLIVTSSFLGYFEPQQRARLFAQYAKLLAPAGRLVFANRLRELPEDQPIGFGASQTVAFLARAQQANAALAPKDQIDEANLALAVNAYCKNFKSYPVASEQSLTASLVQGGLQALSCHSVQARSPKSTISQKLAGPTLADGSTYILVEAGKI